MKTIESINRKIREGKAVVVTASEIKKMLQKNGPERVLARVDAVTCATFSPMCSSGAFLNVGHVHPPTKMEKITLDGVLACGALAAVDLYLGATERSESDPRVGGAHVICRLIQKKGVELKARGRPTACYPGSRARKIIDLNNIRQAYLYNPRNCYQNYNAAVNSGGRRLFTYLGSLKERMGNVFYAGTGEISPLINDPRLRTLGLGSRIFCCGAPGYIAWEGTQSSPGQKTDPATGLPIGPGLTLAVIADMRAMDPDYIRAVHIRGYGVSLYISIGVAIPLLNLDIVRSLAITNEQILTNVVDYATGNTIQTVNYRDLLYGRVSINGKMVPAHTLTDHRGARQVMELLKKKIEAGEFLLNTPVKSVYPDPSQAK